MRHVVGLSAVLVSLALLSGCSTSRAKTPDEVFSAMNKELAQTLDEPTVGTTTLSSETIVIAPVAPVALPEMPLPETRMSLSELTEPAGQTWGTPPPLAPALAELSATRE
jgi:hypothetical protein